MKAVLRLYVSSLDYYSDKLTVSEAGSTVYYKDIYYCKNLFSAVSKFVKY